VWFVQTQFDVYDEHIFNAVSLAYQLASENYVTDHFTPGPFNNSVPATTFLELNGGQLSLNSGSRSIPFFFSVWTLNRTDGYFYVTMETSATSSWRYIENVDNQFKESWSGRKLPSPDACEFESCLSGSITSSMLSELLRVVVCVGLSVAVKGIKTLKKGDLRVVL